MQFEIIFNLEYMSKITKNIQEMTSEAIFACGGSSSLWWALGLKL